MSNVERYEALMKAALEALQLKIELRRKLVEVSENISCYELSGRSFESDVANKALAILAADVFKVREAMHVKSVGVYRDVEINLHEVPEELGGKAMARILEGLSDAEILGS